jgi:hypothetical protein
MTPEQIMKRLAADPRIGKVELCAYQETKGFFARAYPNDEHARSLVEAKLRDEEPRGIFIWAHRVAAQLGISLATGEGSTIEDALQALREKIRGKYPDATC